MISDSETMKSDATCPLISSLYQLHMLFSVIWRNFCRSEWPIDKSEGRWVRIVFI